VFIAEQKEAETGENVTIYCDNATEVEERKQRVMALISPAIDATKRLENRGSTALRGAKQSGQF
jgi:hypothetical protein